jgi:phage shock protein A
MGLFDRMSRAVSANFNALLDRLEDPKKDIELTLRDMEEQLRLARQEIVASVASEKQLRKKADDLAGELEKWERRAELAVKHGDDDLAREALRKRKRLAAERDRAEELRQEQRGLALERKAELERMERALSDAKARRGLLATRVEQARAGGGAEGLGARAAGGDAFSEFRRMEDQIEGVEASIAAQREVEEALRAPRGPSGLSRDEVEAKFRALEAETASSPDEDVDQDLKALKARIRIE